MSGTEVVGVRTSSLVVRTSSKSICVYSRLLATLGVQTILLLDVRVWNGLLVAVRGRNSHLASVNVWTGLFVLIGVWTAYLLIPEKTK